MRLEVLTALVIKNYFSWGLRDSVVWLISSKFEEEYVL
jgi:hypothetical protein